MLHIKEFQYKKQQSGYYNKLRKDTRIEICWMETNAELGYIVCWKYKENKKN
jgi:hypothetical protein